MDVRLPDGTIVRNVPEGTTKADLMARLERTMPADRFAAIKAEGQVVKPPTPFVPSGEKALTGYKAVNVPGYGQVELPSSGTEVLANPYGRAAVGFTKPFIGGAQLAANAIGQGEGINAKVNSLRDSTAKAREYVGSRGIDLADLTGQAAALAIPAAGMTNAATTAGRIGQGAQLGFLGGLTAPVEDVQDGWDYLGKKAIQTTASTAAGAAMPALWEAGKAVGRGVRNVFQPHMGQWGADRAAGRLANTAAGDKQAEIVAALRNPDQFVQGSMPTAAQAAAKTNSAEFPAVMEIAAQRKPTPYVESGQRQNQARIAALRTVGKTPADLEAAIAQRGADAAKNYGDAYQTAIKGDTQLLSMSRNPFFKEALNDANRLAEANGINPKTDLTQYLHYVKVALDKQLTRSGDTALANTEKQAVQNIKTKLVDWLATKNPAYDAARTEFAAASKPINQMEVGQYLEGKLVPAISEDAKQRAAAYAQALRDAPGTIKRATGQPRFDNMGQIMDPTQMQTLRGVKHDLERDALTNALASKGMPAARRLLVEAVPDAPSPGIFNQTVAALRAGYNRIGGKATDKIIDDLAIRGQNPQEVARVMELAKPFKRRALVDALMRYQAPATVAATNEGVE